MSVVIERKSEDFFAVGGQEAETTEYEWDAENRLIAIDYENGSRTEMAYDGLGRRSWIKDTGVGGSENYYLWEGSSIVEKRAMNNSVVKRYFGYGEQWVANGGKQYYYTFDHLGSIREMTDKNGTIRARYDYSPYGIVEKVSGDLDADFRFTGHHYHEKSSLHLTLFRAYDAEMGRWLSADPIGEAGGLNLYAYVGNDPVNYWDPLGLCAASDAASKAAAHKEKMKMREKLDGFLKRAREDFSAGRPTYMNDLERFHLLQHSAYSVAANPPGSDWTDSLATESLLLGEKLGAQTFIDPRGEADLGDEINFMSAGMSLAISSCKKGWGKAARHALSALGALAHNVIELFTGAEPGDGMSWNNTKQQLRQTPAATKWAAAGAKHWENLHSNR